MGRKIKPGWFIRLDEFLLTCHQAIAEQGPEAVVIHGHTRKHEPRSGRIEIAPEVWSRVLGRDTEHGSLQCECRAGDIIDAHADGRLVHRAPPKPRNAGQKP